MTDSIKPTPYRPRTCSRCGAVLPSVDELAALALRTRKALDGMRLALPDELTKGVRGVADALQCYAGACSPPLRRGY